ncbi:MAG: cytidine deaminase [Pseudomonadota bacterium]
MMSDKELFEAAKKAAQCAYSPYSGVCVGAVAVGESGRHFTGCNIENASYGLTVCAERVALFSMVASGETSLVKMAVCVVGADGDTLSPEPCGACLQCLAEFGSDDLVIVTGPDTTRVLRDHLPRPFRLSP